MSLIRDLKVSPSNRVLKHTLSTPSTPSSLINELGISGEKHYESNYTITQCIFPRGFASLFCGSFNFVLGLSAFLPFASSVYA